MRPNIMALLRRARCGLVRRVRSFPHVSLLLAVAAILTLDAALASARPGGGQDFSGGGGGSGDSGAWMVVVEVAIWILRLCIDYPAVGLPLVGCLIVGGVVWHYVSPKHRTKAAVADLEAAVLRGVNRDLRTLADRDPGIQEEAFLQQVAKTVLAVQQAWCAGDMRPARRLLSDGVHNRFTALIAMNRALGYRNGMAESTIEKPAVAAVERDAFFDTVHVRVAGRARDADVPLAATPEQAQKILRKARLERYVEVWSFLRRPGAQTKAGQTVIEGRCPNCGADQPVGDVVECPFCHALVNSGEYGWVLAEITQASEWRPGSTGTAIDGMEEMQSLDPNFNRQQIEDRASFLFWKWVEARVTRNPAAARKLTTERLSNYVASEAASGGIGGGKTVMEHVAVGSADLVGVDPAQEGGMDRAFVRIRWSAAYAKGAAPMPSTNVLVLVRQSGVATKVGLSGDRCKGCGAPLVTATDSPKCDYCGAELAAGKQDWVLDEIAAPTAIVRTGPGRRAPRPPAATAQGAVLPAMAMAPMVFAPIPMMPPAGPAGFAAPVPPVAPHRAPVMPQPAFPAPVAQVPAAVPAAPPSVAAPSAPPSGTAAADDDVEEPGEEALVPPWALPDMSSPQERAALLARMAVIAAADGVVTRQERRLLKKCSKRWGVPFQSVEPILRTGVASLQALSQPENPQRFLMGLVAAALVDGRVDRKERQLLEGVARNLGLETDVVPGLITAMTEWRNRQASTGT